MLPLLFFNLSIFLFLLCFLWHPKDFLQGLSSGFIVVDFVVVGLLVVVDFVEVDGGKVDVGGKVINGGFIIIIGGLVGFSTKHSTRQTRESILFLPYLPCNFSLHLHLSGSGFGVFVVVDLVVVVEVVLEVVVVDVVDGVVEDVVLDVVGFSFSGLGFRRQWKKQSISANVLFFLSLHLHFDESFSGLLCSGSSFSCSGFSFVGLFDPQVESPSLQGFGFDRKSRMHLGWIQ